MDTPKKENNIVFGKIREAALEEWNTGLKRKRSDRDLSDDYSESNLCAWQDECTDNGKHCSFLCSFGDWLDNISDLLRDERFDKLDTEEYEVLFRYYTRILLIISELIEDMVMVNKTLKEFRNKKEAGEHFEKGIFEEGELQMISDFINSVCKHKTERDNLHVHNHHLTIEFENFGATQKENQVRLDQQNWTAMNQDTTILMPPLSYFTGIIIRLDERFSQLLKEEKDYKEKLFAKYADDWQPKKE